MRLTEALAAAAQKLAADSGDQITERRRDRRIPTRESAEIHWRDDLGLPYEDAVTVVNVSARGLAFLTNIPVREGDPVTLRTERHTVDCVVRYCCVAEGRRYAGVEVVAGSERTDIASAVERLDQELADLRAKQRLARRGTASKAVRRQLITSHGS